MKKSTQILMLALLVLTFTQCRKGIEPDYTLPNSGEKITFTLNAESGSTGAKTEILQNGTALNVTWSEGRNTESLPAPEM